MITIKYDSAEIQDVFEFSTMQKKYSQIFTITYSKWNENKDRRKLFFLNYQFTTICWRICFGY